MKIGTKLKNLRKKAKPKVSQVKLGKSVGIYPNHISMIERCEHVPSYELANRIVEALGHEIVFRKRKASKSD